MYGLSRRRPWDQLHLGFLYLDRGRWGNRLASEFIVESALPGFSGGKLGAQLLDLGKQLLRRVGLLALGDGQ